MNKYDIDLTGASWHKSSFSDTSPQSCVEVARVHGHYAVRDSKNRDQAPLVFTPHEWEAFRSGVLAGEFD